jgi:hypothetical protein
MELLITLGGLLLLLCLASFSCARSYFEHGRLHGMEEAIRELMKGVCLHCGSGGQPPDAVITALDKLKTVADQSRARNKASMQRHHAELWSLGDAIGEACWLQGHGSGVRRKAPAEGKIRVDLSLRELLQLIPCLTDQNPCAHWRNPMDMIFQGRSTRVFQA